MSRGPGVLKQPSISLNAGIVKIRTYHVSTPLQASQEDDQSGDTQEATNKINTADNFPPAKPKGVGSRRREIEEDGDQKTEGTPRSTEGADITPVTVVRDKLGP